MGLSFSIPIGTAMDIYAQIKATGKVTRVYLGVALQDIDRNLAQAYKLSKPQGALITRVAPDSPAQKAGLKSGDVVLEFNGQSILQASDLLNLTHQAKVKEPFVLSYQRAGVRHSAQGIFDEVPSDMLAGTKSNEHIRLGLRLKELSVSENAMLARFDVKGGLVISSVETASLAERAGLQTGDIVVSLNQIPTHNIQEFGRAINSLPKEGVVTVGIIRDGTPAILGLRIE